MVFNLKLCPIEVNFKKVKVLTSLKLACLQKKLRIPNPNNVSPTLATWFNFESNLKNTEITKIKAESNLLRQKQEKRFERDLNLRSGSTTTGSASFCCGTHFTDTKILELKYFGRGKPIAVSITFIYIIKFILKIYR